MLGSADARRQTNESDFIARVAIAMHASEYRGRNHNRTLDQEACGELEYWMSEARCLVRAMRPYIFIFDDLEREAVQIMGGDLDLSQDAVMRQALRYYQLVSRRIQAGETISFSGDMGRTKAFAGHLTDV